MVDFEDANDNIFGKLAGFSKTILAGIDRFWTSNRIRSYCFPLISLKTSACGTRRDMVEAITF